MNTRQFAARINILPQSIHARYCRAGSYFGVVPEKLPNGHLVWPDDAVEQLKESARKHGYVDKTRQAREAKAAKRTATEGASQSGAA